MPNVKSWAACFPLAYGSPVKSPVLLGVLLSTLAPGALANEHRIEVGPEVGAGFSFDVPVDSADGPGNVSVDGAPVYGGRLSYRVQSNGFVYLTYHHQDTTAYFREAGEFETSGTAPIAFDHLQFGGNLAFRYNSIVPYFGFGLGGLRIGSRETSGSSLSFSVSFDGGFRWELLPFLHLSLIGRLPITFVTGDSGALCVNYGCVFHYRGDPLVQAQVLLGAGLQF